MTKEDVSQYIKDKIIPIRFIWEDDMFCFLRIWCDDHTLNFIDEGEINWEFEIFNKPQVDYGTSSKFYFCSEKNTVEECLGEFLIWWEINKGRCKSIEYYENNCNFS